MSLGGFTGEESRGLSNPSGVAKMLADGLYSYEMMSTVAMSQPLQMVHSSPSQPVMFSSSPLCLALEPKMENLSEMGMTGQGYGGGLIGRTREDEIESRSSSEKIEALSGDDQNASENKSVKRKKYHRHSAFQIQELESSFKQNPHPDEKERSELGNRLGLDGRQVKFWFQNRRTQMKTQLERHENSLLKQENDKLRIENIAMKEAMRSPTCNNCGGPAILGEVPVEQHHLLLENARLKEELNRLGFLSTKYLGTTNSSMPQMPPVIGNSSLDLAVGRNGFCGSLDPALPLGLDFGSRVSNGFPLMSPGGPPMGMMNANAQLDKSLFVELALTAMDELLKLAQFDSPLWIGNFEGSGELLNIDEYAKICSSCIGVKPSHFVSKGTRATGTVMMDGVALVEALMDVNKWAQMFPWNIGRASTFDVILTGKGGNRNGTLQLMQAEFQVLSSMVPVHQVRFIRFCKQHAEDIWAVVDVSVDPVFQGLSGNSSVNYRRLPSGCIVQDMPNGNSKVTWIEHVEYDENVVHNLYRPVLRSGIAFGAQKWVANLQRQCELFAIIMSSAAPDGDHSELAPSGKRSVAKLALRMSRSFCTGVCATVHEWETVQIAEDTKLMMRKSTGNLGEPPGVILSATTTVWIPVSPQRLLEFLKNEKSRGHWDVLSQDGSMQQQLLIPKSQDPGNSVYLLRTKGPAPAPGAKQNTTLILQDICTDASGSIIVHAAVDSVAISKVMNGDDSSNMPILPSGFAIVPHFFPDPSNPENVKSGSLLTVGFQILANSPATAKLTMESVDTVKSLMARTLQGVKAGIQGTS